MRFGLCRRHAQRSRCVATVLHRAGSETAPPTSVACRVVPGSIHQTGLDRATKLRHRRDGGCSDAASAIRPPNLRLDRDRGRAVLPEQRRRLGRPSIRSPLRQHGRCAVDQDLMDRVRELALDLVQWLPVAVQLVAAAALHVAVDHSD